MRGVFLRYTQCQLLMGARLSQRTQFLCSSTNNTNTHKAAEKAPSVRDFDAYRQLEKLDFMTAVKILFTAPPKKKKFGLDFHLVQLFFACMPSLAVYLVAQYARYEIRRMEAEVEVKKKIVDEEEKAKEMEALALEEEKKKSDPELLQVKVRLDALEDALKGIVHESKKPSGLNLTKDQESKEKEEPETAKPNSQGKADNSGGAVKDDQPGLTSKPDPNLKAVIGPDLANNHTRPDQRNGTSKQ